MKRLLVFLIAVFLSFAVVFPQSAAYAANLSDSVVLQMTGTYSDDEIVINVNLITNTGVSAMTLELEYDRNVFDFIRYEKGQALDSLDLMSTNLSEDPTLPVKFNWFNQTSDVGNDFSTGNLLRLHFTLKADAPAGKYEIGFKSDPQGEAVYVSNGNAYSKTAIVANAVINVSENKVTEIETKTAETPVNWLLIGGIAFAALALGGIITVLILKLRKAHGRNKNWLKL